MDENEKSTPKKVQSVALSYYSRKDIQKEIIEFCRNRETVANFNNEFFAKRPDKLEYPSDIITQVRSGATSFHCSQELWTDPLDIRTEMKPEEYNEIRTGWDFLIDIDSKYFDYSKIAAQILIKALKLHGVNNFGIKYSGSKGFHIIVPFKSFPEEISGIKTKNKFPEWARLIANYLTSIIHEELTKEILKMTSEEDLGDKKLFEIKCKTCKNVATTKSIGKYVCPNFKCKAEVESMKSNRKEMICPSCNGKMRRVSEEEVNFCETCKTNSKKLPNNFEEVTRTKELIDSVDLVLVSPRHLFRAPYSLHEKTSFASIVLKEEELKNFKPTDADPLKIREVRSYMPQIFIPGQAKDLLMQALDYAEKKEPKEKKFTGESIDLKGLKITEEMFPPTIKKLMQGMKSDGRKRALSVILSFFSSLEFPKEFIEEKIEEWNKKNYHPLKEGYIKSQIDWYCKNKRLPPNYDKPIYKEFGNLSPEETQIKNPINYTIRMALKFSAKKSK